jgi:hypothetical protein
MLTVSGLQDQFIVEELLTYNQKSELNHMKISETALFQLLFQLTFLYGYQFILIIQGVPGGKVSILGGHSIGHSKQTNVYVHVSYSERLPR